MALLNASQFPATGLSTGAVAAEGQMPIHGEVDPAILSNAALGALMNRQRGTAKLAPGPTTDSGAMNQAQPRRY